MAGMTPGAFGGMVGDALGVGLEMIADLQRYLAKDDERFPLGRGAAAHQVELQEAAELIVAICARVCGRGVMRACRAAKDTELGWAAIVAKALLAGESFRYDRIAPTDGMTVGASIPASTMKSIRDRAGFVSG